MMQNAEAKALQQLLQLNDQSVEAEGKMQTGDRVARSSSHEPTYVVIKDDAPVVLKPWARTPTPSPLLRRSRPQSSLEKWCYNEVDRQQQKDDMAFKKMFQQEIKQLLTRGSNNENEHVYVYVNDTLEEVPGSNRSFEVYLKAKQSYRSVQQSDKYNFIRPHAPTPAASLHRIRPSPRRNLKVSGRSSHSKAVVHDTFTLQHCEDSVGEKYIKEYAFFATLASNGRCKFQQVLKQCKHYIYFQKVWADCIETSRPRRAFEHRLMKDVISTDRFCIEFSLKQALEQVQPATPCVWAVAAMSNFDVDSALQNYYNPLEKYTSYRKQEGFSRYGTKSNGSQSCELLDNHQRGAPGALRAKLKNIRFQCKNLVYDHEMSFWLGGAYRVLQPILSMDNFHLFENALKKLVSGSYEVIEGNVSNSRPWGRKIRIEASNTGNIISGSALPYSDTKAGYGIHGWMVNLQEKCELHLVREFRLHDNDAIVKKSTGRSINSTSHRFSFRFYPGVTVLVSRNPTHQIVLLRRYRLRGNVESFRQTRISKKDNSQQNHNGMLCLSKDQKILQDIRSHLKHCTQGQAYCHDTKVPKIFVVGSNQMKSQNDKKAKSASTFSQPKIQNLRTRKHNKIVNWHQPIWLPDPFFQHQKLAVERPSTTPVKRSHRAPRGIDVMRPTSVGRQVVVSYHRPKQAQSIRIISPKLNLLKKTHALKKTKVEKRQFNIFSHKPRAKEIAMRRIVEIKNGTMPLSLTVKTLAMG